MAFGDFYKMFNKDFGTGEFLQEESNKNSLFVSSLKTIGRSLVSFVTEPIAGVVNFFTPGKGDTIRDSVYSHVGSETLLKSDKTKMDSIKTWVGSLFSFCFGLDCLVASPFYDIYDGGRKLFFPKGYQEHLYDLDKKAMVRKLLNFEENFLDFYYNVDFFNHSAQRSKMPTFDISNKNKIPEIIQKINELLEEWKQIDAYFKKGNYVPDKKEQDAHRDSIYKIKQFFKEVLGAIKSADNSVDASPIYNNISSINENVIVAVNLKLITEDIKEDNYSEFKNINNQNNNSLENNLNNNFNGNQNVFSNLNDSDFTFNNKNQNNNNGNINNLNDNNINNHSLNH